MHHHLLLISLLITLAQPQIHGFKDTTKFDVIFLKNRIIKGKFIKYDSLYDQILFLDESKNDTIRISISKITLLKLNSEQQALDTLYLSFAQTITGKILSQDTEFIVFWDQKSKKILILDKAEFLNYSRFSLNDYLIFNPFLYFSLSFTAMTVSISFYFSKDLYNSIIFFLLAVYSLWLLFFVKNKIK